MKNIYIKTLKNLLRESRKYFFFISIIYHNHKRLSRLLTITPCRAWEHSALSSGPQDGDRILLLTSIFLYVLQGSSFCLLTASPLLLHSHFWLVIWSGLRQLIFTTLVFLLRCLYDFLPWMKLIINISIQSKYAFRMLQLYIYLVVVQKVHHNLHDEEHKHTGTNRFEHLICLGK